MLGIKQAKKSSPHSNLLAVKISNFNPELHEIQSVKERYSQEGRINQRRNMVTSSLQHRPRHQAQLLSYRIIKTAQQSRFSQYVEKEISKIHQDKAHLQQFSPLVRDKIKQLRGLIQEKALALRKSPPQQYCFSEYKMKNREESRKLSLTLHSRKKVQSPFMKVFRSRKIPEQSYEIASQSVSSNKKMVLIGGSISYGETSQIIHQNPRLTSPKKVREQRGKIHHRYYLRRVLERPAHDYASQIPQNDCKPWQFHKLQHMQEYGNPHIYS